MTDIHDAPANQEDSVRFNEIRDGAKARADRLQAELLAGVAKPIERPITRPGVTVATITSPETPAPSQQIIQRPARPVPALASQQSAGDGFDLIATPSHARISSIEGQILKYAKGEWRTNRGATLVPLGTIMIVRGAAEKLCLFVNQKLQRVIERVEGVQFPARETLGYLDESQWPLGPGGKPSDPWQPTVYLTLFDLNEMRDFTYMSSTWGGTRAVRTLCQQISYKRRMYGRNDLFVRVKLDIIRTQHKEYGTILDPTFVFVDMVDPITLRPVPAPTLNQEINDQNPF